MIKYTTCKKTFERNGKKEEKWVATKVQHQGVSFDKLVKRVVNASSATRGDVELVIDGLISEIENALLEGMSVKVGRLGTFDLSISSEPHQEASEIKPSHVSFNKVFFKAGSELRQKVRSQAEFERIK